MFKSNTKPSLPRGRAGSIDPGRVCKIGSKIGTNEPTSIESESLEQIFTLTPTWLVDMETMSASCWLHDVNSSLNFPYITPGGFLGRIREEKYVLLWVARRKSEHYI